MKIVVDTNIVFSGILNPLSRIGKVLIFSKESIQFYTCDYLRNEIQKHRNKLLSITKLSASKLEELEGLVTNNIKFINEWLLPKELLANSELLLQDVDPNDTPFVALTTYMEAKLWTGDMQLYNGLTPKNFMDVISTAELSLLLQNIS